MGDQRHEQLLPWTAVMEEQATAVMEEQATAVIEKQATAVMEEQATAVMEEQTTNAYGRIKKRNSHHRR
jgi:hypothetical protein